MFERFIADARRVVFIAATEAQHRNADHITVGDLLLGLTRERPLPSPTAKRLHELAVPLRASLGIPHLPITSRPLRYQPGSMIPMKQDAKQALANAVTEANTGRDYWVDCDHLLCGLLVFQNDARDALMSFEFDLDAVRQSSRQFRKDNPLPNAPRWRSFVLWLAHHPDLVRWFAYMALFALLGLLLVVLLKIRQ